MRTRSIRRTAAIGTTLGVTASTLFAVPASTTAAAGAPPLPDPATLATTLTQRLGGQSAGSYLDRDTGQLVVTVTDDAAARRVRAAGGLPQMVTRSAAALDQAEATLGRSAKVAGTAWAVDPKTNQVVLSVDESVTGARLRKVRAAVESIEARLGDAVRLERVPGTFSLRIRGGNAIYGGSSRCSLGFNVRSGGTYYFLTAGHCGDIASAWYSNSAKTTRIGTRRASSFPGNDYAIITYASGVSHPGSVYLYSGTQDITRAANAVVGQSVRRSGSTTGVHSGTVTATNQTVNYAEGSVSGLIRTTVCAEPGDSGGPLYAGGTALGLTSGGSGNCLLGGTTFFQPVTEPLRVYGVSVY